MISENNLLQHSTLPFVSSFYKPSSCQYNRIFNWDRTSTLGMWCNYDYISETTVAAIWSPFILTWFSVLAQNGSLCSLRNLLSDSILDEIVSSNKGKLCNNNVTIGPWRYLMTISRSLLSVAMRPHVSRGISELGPFCLWMLLMVWISCYISLSIFMLHLLLVKSTL